ncbi:hypothetical protein IJ384_03295 [bacterium]|nr:hypothetical protein [bacterium]
MQDIDIKKIIEEDEYLVERQDPTQSERELFLKEAGFACCLCGKDLRNHSDEKQTRLYEIAHIYPNRPTKEQYVELNGVERLGINSETFENKIALCRDCHKIQDHHTKREEYIKLLNIKKRYLTKTRLLESTFSLGLEKEIAYIVEKIINIDEDKFVSLSEEPVKLTRKFLPKEYLLKSSIQGYVMDYYTYIRELFKSIDGKNDFQFEILCLQIKACYKKMSKISSNKEDVFNSIVDWIKKQTGSESEDACRVVVAFFVQNCEVFDEITE